MTQEDGYGGIDTCPKCDAEVLRAHLAVDVYLSTYAVPYRHALVLLKYREPAYLVFPRHGRGWWVAYWYGKKPERGHLCIAHRCGYWP